MYRSPTEYLRHILDETTYLETKNEGLSRNDFLADETVQRFSCTVGPSAAWRTAKLGFDSTEPWSRGIGLTQLRALAKKAGRNRKKLGL